MTTKENIKNVAKSAAEQTASAAKDAANSAKEAAREHAEQTKENVAGEVRSVASALRTASDEMRAGSPQERAVGQIAESLADVSDSIKDQDLGQMVSAATDFARRNPLVFLGSAAFLGFAAARFAKSSNSDDQTPDHVASAPTVARTPSHPGAKI